MVPAPVFRRLSKRGMEMLPAELCTSAKSCRESPVSAGGGMNARYRLSSAWHGRLHSVKLSSMD